MSKSGDGGAAWVLKARLLNVLDREWAARSGVSELQAQALTRWRMWEILIAQQSGDGIGV